MRRLALLAAVLAMLPGAAPLADEGIPTAFQGAWAREGGHCTEGNVQVDGMTTIQPWYIVDGELGKHAMAVRLVSPVQIGVDSKDSFDEDDSWTATTLLTLGEGGQRLTLLVTRKNGHRLRAPRPEMYRRCP
jgi:hypothetical protein